MNSSILVISSIAKKIIQSLAGLFLILFLLVHLTINLTLLIPDEGETFMLVSGFMGSNICIKIFEIVLFAGFIIHIILGIILFIQNWLSRPIKYYKFNKSYTSFFSKYMIHTGVLIFIFLMLHFFNFYFVKHGIVALPDGITDTHDFYNMAISLFSNTIYSIIYLISFIFLGFHLNHALQSGFQTLGLEHKKYTPAVKIFSTIYSIIIAVGFAIIPLYFLLLY